jgi:hypothetical protein
MGENPPNLVTLVESNQARQAYLKQIRTTGNSFGGEPLMVKACRLVFYQNLF